MKALLLIGASLMAGAGIYGYADYKKANLKKEFQSLYKEEPPKAAQEPVRDVAPVAAPVVAVKRDIKAEEKKPEAISKKYEKKQKRTTIIKAADFSRAALEKEEILLPPTEEVKP